MLPLIGIVVSSYVFTRMVELAMDDQAHVFVRGCAFVSMLVAVFVGFMLLVSGTSPTEL